jgi:hypothetical protein
LRQTNKRWYTSYYGQRLQLGSSRLILYLIPGHVFGIVIYFKVDYVINYIPNSGNIWKMYIKNYISFAIILRNNNRWVRTCVFPIFNIVFIFASRFKTELKLENCLLRLHPVHRNYICKLRTSNIKFPIETGRWVGLFSTLYSFLLHKSRL